MSGCETPGLMPVEVALEMILAKVPEVPSCETVYLEQAVGRVLADSPQASVDVPPADNSSMDGYAVRLSDLTAGKALPVSQRIPAGQAPQPLVEGSVARIFTGAEIPVGADAVIMQEQAEVTPEGVLFSAQVSVGENIRRQGQDLRAGQPVLAKGTRLMPADIGVLASTGLDSVLVYRPLKVAILSTGDELVDPGEALGPGQIYNSNRFVLSALLTQMGCVPVDIGRVADTADDTRQALEKAAAQADCIISTGGVSVGEEDHVKAAVESLGELSVWKLKIKPGKPLAFGHVQGVPFFGLPGNPASTLVTFCVIARSFILQMQGAQAKVPLTFQVPAGFARKPAIRQEYLRARIEQQRVVPFYNQNSGVLSSASWADGLAIVPPDTAVQEGDAVAFIPFSELLG